MLLTALGNLAVMIVVAVMSARVGACFMTRLRILQFERVSSFSMEEINCFSTASLITTFDHRCDADPVLHAMLIRIRSPRPSPHWAITKITSQGQTLWSWAASVWSPLLVIIFYLQIRYAQIPENSDPN